MVFDPTGQEKNLMLDSKIIYRYIHGGQGCVTLVAPKSLKAHQYAFCTPTNRCEFPEDTIFIYVIHEGHKMYLGMLSGPELRLTRRSTFREDTEVVKGARYIVKMSNRQDLVDQRRMNLYHSGTCCICGRALKSDKALYEGIGKKCKQYYNIHLMQTPWDGNG